jgi:phosphosulfolactate synthase (CoM biosynthesis protein A)
MSAFIELTSRPNTLGQPGHKVLVNSLDVRKVYAREPEANGGTVIVWTGNSGEHASPQLEVAESYADVCKMLGAGDVLVELVDGDVRYRSLP